MRVGQSERNRNQASVDAGSPDGLAKSFRDLHVYQNALSLVVDVHQFCKTLPPQERFVLTDQMRRASRSVCANLAEAWRKRRYGGAFVSKLSDAETEATEMQCWCDVGLLLGYMSPEQYKAFDDRYDHVIGQTSRMIQDAPRWCRNALGRKG